MIEIKARVRGVNNYIRDLASANDITKRGAIYGVIKAAEYLKNKVIEKIGKYQRGWAKLKYETISRKLRKYGVGNKPLLMTGALKESFKVVKGGSGRIAASVGSDSPYLVHHVYGAPRANVPQRDPLRVTAVEEKDACTDIIDREIQEALRKAGL